MAIIYSYPTVIPTTDDLILGTDVNTTGRPTKNFTISSLIDLINAGSSGLGAVIKLTTPPGDASDPITPFANQPIVNLSNITGTGIVSFPTINSTTIANTGAITTATLSATGNITSSTIIQAATFQTTAGTAKWTGTILTGFTSITKVL